MPKLNFDKLKLKLPKLGGSKAAEEAPAADSGDSGDKKKKTAMAAISVVAVAIVGWVAWDTFMVEPPPPPPPPPVAAAKPPAAKVEISPDKLVDELITVSGLRKQIDRIPDQVIQGARQSSAKSKDQAVIAEVEKIMTEALKPERFQKRVRDALTKDFDRKRVEGLIKTLNTPLMKKMAELEGKDVKPEELAAFAKGLAKTPIAKERLQLLQDYDATSKSSEFATELVMGTTRAMVAGAVGGDAAKLAQFDREFGKQKGKLGDAVRDATLLTLAYMYRDVPDTELAEYTKFYTTDDAKWFVGQAMNALLEEFRAGAQQSGERIVEMAKSKKPASAAAETKSAKAPAAEAVAMAPAESAARPLTARSKLDARECLKQETNQAIHRCAEGYR